MPAVAIFAIATCAAVLMLIASMRALTWHKVSPFLNTILLLLVLFVTWQVVAQSGPIAPEQWILFVLSALVGMVLGVVRGQAARMRFEAREGDVLCRRGALLMFCWAVVVVSAITLLTMPSAHRPGWAMALPPALIFLTAAIAISSLTIFARVSTLREENLLHPQAEPQPQQEPQAQ
ncbi:MAG TPA: hypothetical protein VFU69_10955 [Ktedonobacterales bacterium]|nr:hypothetical protein [Ktedonobacterales bacterium]